MPVVKVPTQFPAGLESTARRRNDRIGSLIQVGQHSKIIRTIESALVQVDLRWDGPVTDKGTLSHPEIVVSESFPCDGPFLAPGIRVEPERRRK